MIDLESKVQQIKRECLELCINAGAGHVTSAFSCAEIVTLLYYEIMNVKKEARENGVHDRFIMSKNHGSVITYPVLADLGYVSHEEIKTFLKDGSKFGMHSKLGIPGIDFAGGALGIGIGVACGMAYAAKQNVKPYKIYCIVGDGECYEGSVWEAAMFASHNKLNNLIVIIDRNKLAITDYTENMVALESLSDKWKAFGFEVHEVQNGHDFSQLRNALNNVSSKPLCVIANTVKGHGVDFLENNILMHGCAPLGEKAEIALKQVGGQLINECQR